MTSQRPPPPPMLQALIVWGILLASQGMIVLVAQTAVVNPPSAPDQVIPASSAGAINPMIFQAIAVLVVAAAILIPRVLMNSLKAKNPASSFEVAGAFDARAAMQKVLPIWIVRWALLEAVTMMGFVTSMLTTNPPAIYPFAGAALVGFVLTAPNEAKLKKALQ